MTLARRRTRLALTLAGLALAICGVIIYGEGTVAESRAKQAAIDASGDVWRDILGEPSVDSWTAADEARWDREAAEDDQVFGIVLALIGAALVAGRFAIRPLRLVGGQPEGQFVGDAVGFDGQVGLAPHQQQADDLP